MQLHRLLYRLGLSLMAALAVVMNLIALSSAEAGMNKWTATAGPEGGTILAIAVAPSDPRIIYITTDSTLFRSTDGGESWTIRSRELHAAVGGYWTGGPRCGVGREVVHALVVDPEDPQVLYASGVDATGNGGIFKSTDGGETWSATNLTFPHTGGMRAFVVIAPVARHILYARIECNCEPNPELGGPGLFRSADDGQTWTRVQEEGKQVALQGAVWVTTDALAVDPHDPQILYEIITPYHREETLCIFYVAHPSIIFRSTDEGEQWTALSTFSVPELSTLVIDPLNPLTFYAGGPGSIFKRLSGN